ncbi:MAG: signal recognition particle-docking protein FtsY [Rickettsiales bacterium]|jgi:fused signal recognition particle receptor|nr:signal recognition particle-docking protein FtsY [Rickettsiales bacterium]
MLFGLGAKISALFTKKKLDAAALESLEELLVASDISYDIVSELVAQVRRQRFGSETSDSEVKAILKAELLKILAPSEGRFEPTGAKPFSIVMVGVNGGGKTTTIGKLACKYAREGKSVSIAACDTFRASAAEQLAVWAERAGARLVSRANADPSGLAYDAFGQAIKNGDDVAFFDTAGRLSNNESLMAELGKVIRTLGKVRAGAPDATLLVLDGSGGQNSLAQMEKFGAGMKIDGLVITKTEGTSKGGFLITLARKYRTPVYFSAFGEGENDIKPFDAEKFIDNLLEMEGK